MPRSASAAHLLGLALVVLVSGPARGSAQEAADPPGDAGCAESSEPDPTDVGETDEEQAIFFMPDIDMGVVFYSAPELDPGLVVRAIVDVRFRRRNGPHLRLDFDTTTAGWSVPAESGRPGLSSRIVIYDLLLGAGARFGTEELQVAGTAQAGLAIYALPSLRLDGETVSLRERTEVAGAARGSIALEWYFVPSAALTIEVLGQRYFARDVWAGRDGWSGGASLGLTGQL